MNLANKSFRDNRTGEVITVIDSFENIAILENRTKIDARRLMDPNLYTEHIDPKQFLDNTTNSAYNSLFETIKSIPSDKIPLEDGEMNVATQRDEVYSVNDDGPAVIASSIDDEKAELARKYGANLDSSAQVNRQTDAFARILGEDSRSELPYVAPVEEPVQKVEIVRDDQGDRVSSEYVSPKPTQPAPAPVEKDPYEMFRGIKRGVEFKLDLPLTNRIPKLQFIEMMEESYDKSIIEFLAHDITQEIMGDPDSLRRSIEAKIRAMVYGEEEVVEPAPKKVAPRRTPKPNTAQGEKPGYKKPVRKKATKKETEQE